jgi:hypothetical protein
VSALTPVLLSIAHWVHNQPLQRLPRPKLNVGDKIKMWHPMTGKPMWHTVIADCEDYRPGLVGTLDSGSLKRTAWDRLALPRWYQSS